MKPAAKTGLLTIIVVVWIALDRLSKQFFVDLQPADSLGTILGGLVDLRLVHNTGAAWGVLANNTVGLAVFSLVIVAVLLGYFVWDRKDINLVQVVGIALVVAGGIGNVIDRLTQGYVIDFLAVTFVDFPVFNIADIGVTCGVVLLLIGFLLEWRKEDEEAR